MTSSDLLRSLDVLDRAIAPAEADLAHRANRAAADRAARLSGLTFDGLTVATDARDQTPIADALDHVGRFCENQA